MKKAILPLFFITCLGFLSAQPAIEWKKAYGGSLYDTFHEIKPTSDGGYIVIGQSNSNNGNASGNNGDFDIWVLKLSNTGDIEWKKSLGGSALEAGYFIEQTKDGGYILTGITDSSDGQVTGYHGNTDAWVVKLSPSGEIEWQHAYGGSLYDSGNQILKTDHDTYILLAYTQSKDGDVMVDLKGIGDIWLMELNLTGDILWQRTYGGSDNDNAMDIKTTKEGGYIMLGTTSSNDGDVLGWHGKADLWLLKLGNLGDIEWAKTYGGSNSDESGFGSSSIQILNDGTYIIGATTYSDDGQVAGSHGKADGWLIGVGDTGAMLWQKTLGGSGNDAINSITKTIDEGLALIGYTESLDGDPTGLHGEYDWWVIKLDSLNEIQWQQTVGGDKTEYGYTVLQTEDGGYIFSGISESKNGDMSGFSHPFYEGWIFKFAPDLVGVQDVSAASALNVLPNPASREIRFDLPDGETLLSVNIMDILGQHILEQAIRNDQRIDISTLPNGTYVLQAKTNSGKLFYGKFQKTE
ncbi:MAG TPA: T9SS type A sorting domain-containing protein [Saprospiraceae bacterium]|nr:T9SS type A sorting domain-containing protein [Saprospiraceae bacterium]